LIVNIRATHHAFVLLALLSWLMTGWMGVHSHFCFDGQEPAVSFHVDLVEAHEQHLEEEVHQDFDVSHSVFVKLAKFYSAWLVFVATITLVLSGKSLRLFFYSSISFTGFRPGLRPPLRAPPVVAA
jgi:hypothetical protein